MFITTTTVCVSELNMLLVYPACSKYKYYASEADCRTSARSLSFPAGAHLSLSLFSLSLSLCICSVERLKGAALSVKTQILCSFSNFTCKYSRNHSTAIVFILCVAYLILSDDGTIINQYFCADQHLVRESWLCLNGSCFSHYFIFIPVSDNRNRKNIPMKTVLLRI